LVVPIKQKQELLLRTTS